jgi:hypothetical protein
MAGCPGTSIVILTDQTKIVVAADSKVYRSTEILCKVFKTGTVFWAMSGDIGPWEHESYDPQKWLRMPNGAARRFVVLSASFKP